MAYDTTASFISTFSLSPDQPLDDDEGFSDGYDDGYRSVATPNISPIMTKEFRWNTNTMGSNGPSSQVSSFAPSSPSGYAATTATFIPSQTSPASPDLSVLGGYSASTDTGYTPTFTRRDSSVLSESPTVPLDSPISPIEGSYWTGTGHHHAPASPSVRTYDTDNSAWRNETAGYHVDRGTTATPISSAYNSDSDSVSTAGTASVGRCSSVSGGSVQPGNWSAQSSCRDFRDFPFINDKGYYDSTKEEVVNRRRKEYENRSFFGVMPDTNVTNLQPDSTSYAPSLTSNRSTRSVLSRISSKISDWRRDRRGSGSFSGDESRSGSGSMASFASSISEARTGTAVSKFREAWGKSTNGLRSRVSRWR